MAHCLQGTSVQITVNFLSETTEAKMKCQNIFQVVKEKNCQPRIQHLVKLLQKCRELKTFSDERKQMEFVTSRSTLND